MEYWKLVPGYENYEISSYGRLKTLYREVVKPHPCNKTICTYRYKERITYGSVDPSSKRFVCSLSKDGKVKHFLVSRLVLTVFVGNPPKGMLCCHNNGNPFDNNLNNLRWDSPKSNAKDTLEHGTRKKGIQIHTAKLTEDDIYTIRSISPRRGLYKELAKYYNVNWDTIRRIIKRRSWKHL